MKKIIYLTFALQAMFLQSTFGQIVSLENFDGHPVNGAYYKDVSNRLLPFEGTYLYSEGNNSLEITLQRRKSSMNGFYDEDYIVGEVKYIKNGNVMINTLSQMYANQAAADQSFHTILANFIAVGPDYSCEDCGATEMRLKGSLFEPQSEASASITVRRIMVNGQAAIQLNLWYEGIRYKEGTPAPTPPAINAREFILIKQ